MNNLNIGKICAMYLVAFIVIVVTLMTVNIIQNKSIQEDDNAIVDVANSDTCLNIDIYVTIVSNDTIETDEDRINELKDILEEPLIKWD